MATTVSVEGNAYKVVLENSTHLVEKNRTCSCGVKNCRAITAVEEYLRSGGERAPESLPPCPVCGGKTYRDRKWDGKYTRTLGWRCENGGLAHFLQAKAKRIQNNVNENPWLFQPILGQYPGVLKSELMTWQECQEARERVYAETGYNPAT